MQVKKLNHKIDTGKFYAVEFELMEPITIPEDVHFVEPTEATLFRYEFDRTTMEYSIMVASEDSHFVSDEVTHLFDYDQLEEQFDTILENMFHELPDLTEEYLEDIADEEEGSEYL
jgi:nitric oxide reductase activation protein